MTARALGVAAFVAAGLVIGWFLLLRSERTLAVPGDPSAPTKAAGGSSEAGAATSRLRPASVISVRGLVVDTERRPVAAATVMVLSQGAVGNPTEPRAQTNDRGSFEFDVITRVRDVRIAHPAYYDLAVDRVPELAGT